MTTFGGLMVEIVGGSISRASSCSQHPRNLRGTSRAPRTRRASAASVNASIYHYSTDATLTLTPPTLRERRHRGLARRLVAVRGRGIRQSAHAHNGRAGSE